MRPFRDVSALIFSLLSAVHIDALPVEDRRQADVSLNTSLSPGPSGTPGHVAHDVFPRMVFDPPPDVITRRSDHKVSKAHIKAGDVPIQTNKFYANLFLDASDEHLRSQTCPVWTHPYAFYWPRGEDGAWGMSVAHVDRENFVIDSATNPPKSFSGHPGKSQPIVFDAEELGPETRMYVSDPKEMSANADFAPSPEAEKIMRIPLVLVSVTSD